MKFKKLFTILCSLVLLSSCGENPSEPSSSGSTTTTTTTITEETVPVESVEISQSELNLDLYGETNATLVASVLPENASDKTLNWISTNSSVASVKDGIVTAKKVGTTTVKAVSVSDMSKFDSVTVNVVDSTPIPDKYIFESNDYRVVTNGSKTNDGIGALTGDVLSIEYTVHIGKEEKVKIGYNISTRQVLTAVKDIYSLSINGVKQADSAATIPAEGEMWKTYYDVEIGEYDLVSGDNKITITYDYSKTSHPGVNFKQLLIYSFGEVKLVEPPHTCQHLCDICGKCTDETCKFTSCSEKCTCVKTNYELDVKDSATAYGDISLVNNVMTNVNPYGYGYVKFKFNAEKAGNALLSVNISENNVASWAVCDYFRIYVNSGTKADWDNDSKTGILSKTVYTAMTIQGNSAEMHDIKVGLVNVVAGTNTIVIGWSAVNQIQYSFSLGGIALETVENVITKAPIHLCTSICPICGHCQNAACEEDECLEKCTCGALQNASFKAVNANNYVYTGADANVNDGIDVENDYFQLVGSSANINHLVFNIKSSKASKAALYLTIKASSGLNVSGVDGQNVIKFINGLTGAETNLIANIPNSEEFVSVKLGIVDLVPYGSDGNYNSIKMWLQGWSGNIQIRSLDIYTSQDVELTFPFTPHVCTSICPICGKCTNEECQEPACLEKCNCPKTKETLLPMSTYTYANHEPGLYSDVTSDGLVGHAVSGHLFHFKSYFVTDKVATVAVYLQVKGADGQSFSIRSGSGYTQLGIVSALGSDPNTRLSNVNTTVSLSSTSTTDVYVGSLNIIPGEIGGFATWIGDLSADITITNIKLVADSNITLQGVKNVKNAEGHTCSFCGGCANKCGECAFNCTCEELKTTSLNFADSCYDVHITDYKTTYNDENVIKVSSIPAGFTINHVKSYFTVDKDTCLLINMSMISEASTKSISYSNAEGSKFQYGIVSEVGNDSSDNYVTLTSEINSNDYTNVSLGRIYLKAGEKLFLGFWLNATDTYYMKDVSFVSNNGATVSAVLAK